MAPLQVKGLRRRPVRNSSKAVSHQQLKSALVSFENRTRETKFFGEVQSGNLATAGAILPLTQSITQGDTAATRDGNSINVKDLKIHFQFRINSGATFEDTVRAIVFSDRFAVGAYPPITSLLLSATPTSNYDRQVWLTKRFTIWSDQIIPLGIGGASNANVVRTVTIPLRNLHVEYFGTTDVEASNGSNAIYVLLISNNGTHVSNYIVDSLLRHFDS
jgi:hypothetical protein